jgi:hypothetical protein
MRFGAGFGYEKNRPKAILLLAVHERNLSLVRNVQCIFQFLANERTSGAIC